MKQDVYDGVIVLLKVPGINRSSKQCPKKVKKGNALSVNLGMQILHQHIQYENDFTYEE